MLAGDQSRAHAGRGLLRPGLPGCAGAVLTTALTDERHRDNHAAVAERGGKLVGIRHVRHPDRRGGVGEAVVGVLRVRGRRWHGAARALPEVVVDPGKWVADSNPRARAFCRKYGFVADGTAQVEDGVWEIRMVRCRHHSG